MELERPDREIRPGGSREVCQDTSQCKGHLKRLSSVKTISHHQIFVTGDIRHAALKLPIIAQNEGVWWGDFEELDSQ